MKKLLFTFTLLLMAFMAHAQQSPQPAAHVQTVSTKLGDVNGDGKLTINDVTMLVDYLLEQAPSSFILANADVNKDGRITVSDAVSIIKKIVEGDPEPQAYLTCPDENHPHMIDLGLPSGTKWACCNVGADKPEAYGGYYAWGETEEKDYYNLNNYIESGLFNSLGSNISGTQYDVAFFKWGGNWRMPDLDQIKELLNNCNTEWMTVNGINGRMFTSKINGGKFFLPAAGYRMDSDIKYVGERGNYWSSMKIPDRICLAYCLYIYSGNASWLDWYSQRYGSYGQNVRPVAIP